MSIKIILAK